MLPLLEDAVFVHKYVYSSRMPEEQILIFATNHAASMYRCIYTAVQIQQFRSKGVRISYVCMYDINDTTTWCFLRKIHPRLQQQYILGIYIYGTYFCGLIRSTAGRGYIHIYMHVDKYIIHTTNQTEKESPRLGVLRELLNVRYYIYVSYVW